MNYNNVYSGYNDIVVHGSTTVKFELGYWTFDLIKKKLEVLNGNLTINANENNTSCTVTTDDNLQLKRFGELLGFHNSTIINSRASKTSKTIEINSYLRYIQINCDAVDRTCNIDNNGKRSATLLTLPITTKESLKGSVSHYVDIESKIPIDKVVYNKLNFNVLGNNNKTQIGSILFKLSIM